MKTKQFIITFIITFIVIMVWIAADIIHTQANVPVSASLQQAIIPLNPDFDQTTLEEITKRDNLENKKTIPSQPTITPTPQTIELP